jgi:hypothetical protein
MEQAFLICPALASDDPPNLQTINLNLPEGIKYIFAANPNEKSFQRSF